MTDSPEMIVLFNNSHFRLTSCGKESQSSPRWRAFSFGCASAEGEGALKGRAVGHRPSLGQDEHGVSSVFDLYRTGHSRSKIIRVLSQVAASISNFPVSPGL